VEDRGDTRRQIANDRYHNHWHGYHGGYWHHNDAAWAFFGGLVLGSWIASLPPRYETVYVYSSPSPYYYANGTYYTETSGGYEVVPAPVGVTVEHPPEQVVNVTVNENNYGYSNGAYYDVIPPEEEDAEPTYEVIAPPMGVLVPSLPEGSASTTIEGTDYFTYDGTYYRPFYSGSDVVYQVVEDPTAGGEG
jgi:hypothetical protein